MLKLRLAGMDDAVTLFKWRNDPVTRAMSRDPTPISWENHVAWLTASLRDPSRELIIVERGSDSAQIGTVRFDYGEETEFSFTIAPEFRCRGLSLKLLEIALAGVPECVGYTRRENLTCHRLVHAVGFRIVEQGPIQKWRYVRAERHSVSVRASRSERNSQRVIGWTSC